MELHERLSAARPVAAAPTARRPVRGAQEPRPPRGDRRPRAAALQRRASTRPSCASASLGDIRDQLGDEAGHLARRPRAPGRRDRRRHPRPRPARAAARRRHRLGDHGQRPVRRLDRARRAGCSRPRCASTTSRTCGGSSTRWSPQVGRRIDESSPMVDARLPDGSRVNAIIPPLSLSGPARDDPQVRRRRGSALEDMVRARHALDRRPLEFLERCVQARLNILISGGTGSGKTTLLNALSSADPGQRADRHDRGRGRASAQPAPRAAARVPPEEHRGRGRDRDPRPRPQLAAHAARPDHRRRGSRRRGARHAPGDEHRPRRLALDRPRQHARATRSPASRRWC